MKKLASLLFLVCLSTLAATDIVPKPGDPGNLGASDNRFPSLYVTNIQGPLTFEHNATNFTIYGTNTTNVVSSANTNHIWVASAGTTAANGLYYFKQNIAAITVYSNSTHFLRFDPDDLDYQNQIGAWATIASGGNAQLYGNFQQAGDISTWEVVNGSGPAPTTTYGTNYTTNVYKTFELSGLPMPLAPTSTNVLYVSPDGNDATAIRGRTDRPWLRADIAASDGEENDTIFLLPGVHILKNGIFLQRGQKLIGAGKEVTKVKSSVSFAVSAAIVPADNTTVADLTVENVLCCDPSQAIYGYPNTTDPVGYTNALISRVRFFGGSDLTIFGGTNSVQLTIEDSEMRAFWDGQTFSAAAVTNYVNIRRSHLWMDTRTNNLLSVGSAIVIRQPVRLNLEDVHIRLDSTNSQAHNGILTAGLASGAIVTINGGSITVTNSAARAIDNTGGATINVANCKFDTTKVVGTVNYLVDPATLGSGSSITTKFLRGDSTWQAAGGGDALTSNPLSQFASTTSAQLRGVLSDESGSGVFLTANGDGSSLTSVNAATVTTVDSTDATSFVGIFDSATGNQAAKTDGALTYNASTGIITANGFNGAGSSGGLLTMANSSAANKVTFDAENGRYGLSTTLYLTNLTASQPVFSDANKGLSSSGTFDPTASGVTLKFKQYLYFRGFDVAVGALPINSNDWTAITYMKPRFLNGTDKASNYIEWRTTVPEDIDTSVALRAKVKFRLTGADTAAHRYVASFASVADSASAAGSPSTEVNLDFAGDGSGASGDVESVGYSTLTSWAGSLTAGQLWVVRLARDGDTSDASTVDSDFVELVIEYGTTQ